MKKLLGLCSAAALAVSALTLAPAALAQPSQPSNWPTKAVTLIVPFPAGGSTDAVARAIGIKLTEKTGQSFVVDNRAGATGTIGAAMLKRAAPDGYTLMVTSLGPLVIVPHLMKGLPYDPLKDFDPITVAVQTPNVLVVNAASPFKTLADLITYEKAHPGKMSFASAGSGSSGHLNAELLWQRTGTQGLHVPYKGSSLAANDLLAGQVDASFQNINEGLPFIRSGKFRALAVTSDKRSAVLPDVPTFAEAGVSDAEVTSWQAVVGPRGLPAELRQKIQAAVVEALADPKVRQQFVSAGFEVVGNTPEQFATFQRAEYTRWKKVIEVGKIVLE
ncbi:Bug family tripartite tricarboxylate transporter substrate binding protein [Variovorax sp. HJSM1_2]|uniref:Bug family tripartite tricarboxylate transporter substrate binding protein n=1 Tax=Variovorax sp. HJSM1_2 TaxID=3366263 RepID=UPI003BDAF93C